MNTTNSADRFRRALAALEWHNKSVARRWGVSQATICYCVQGRIRVPEEVLAWLEERAALVAVQRPAPGWPARRGIVRGRRG